MRKYYVMLYIIGIYQTILIDSVSELNKCCFSYLLTYSLNNLPHQARTLFRSFYLEQIFTRKFLCAAIADDVNTIKVDIGIMSHDYYIK